MLTAGFVEAECWFGGFEHWFIILLLVVHFYWTGCICMGQVCLPAFDLHMCLACWNAYMSFFGRVPVPVRPCFEPDLPELPGLCLRLRRLSQGLGGALRQPFGLFWMAWEFGLVWEKCGLAWMNR